MVSRAVPNPRKVRPDRIVSGARGEKKATSVLLSPPELTALKALATKRNVSQSDLIRTAIRQILGEDAKVVPASLGIADGVYPASLHDDVVNLANLVVALGYVVETLESRVSRNRRIEARAQLADVLAQLQRVAGLSR